MLKDDACAKSLEDGYACANLSSTWPWLCSCTCSPAQRDRKDRLCPVNLFSRLDPLLALGSMLAARRAIPTFAPAIITVLATLALGRFWCGWLCPLGTILDLFGPNVRKAIPQRLRQAKHFLLFIIIFAALLANLTLIFLDPITILLRPLAGAIYPGIQRVIATSSENQSLIHPILALPLVIILGLNLLAKRFWCRYLCPLGAFLGLLCKVAWLKRRVGENCVQCNQCVPECPMGTINEEDFTSDPGECIQCLDCFARCPVGAISFGGEWDLSWGYEYDPSRRQLLASLATGAVGVGLLSRSRAQSGGILDGMLAEMRKSSSIPGLTTSLWRMATPVANMTSKAFQGFGRSQATLGPSVLSQSVTTPY